MGSASSRISSRPPRPRSDHGPIKFNFISSSAAPPPPPQIEDQLSDKLVLPARPHDPAVENYRQITVEESLPPFSSDSGASSSTNGHLRSNTHVNNGLKDCSVPSQNPETREFVKWFSESKELLPGRHASYGMDRAHSKRTRFQASTSTEPAQLERSSTNANNTLVPVVEPTDSMNDYVSLPSPEMLSSGVSQQEPRDILENINLTTETHAAGSTLASYASILSSGRISLEDEPLLVAAISSANLQSVGEVRHGSILHVDVVSISLNAASPRMVDLSSNEARRNSRRVPWDTFSRHSTGRNYDSSVLVSSTDDIDDLGIHDRWSLDFSDVLFGSRFDHDSVYLHRRSHGSNGGRWNSRSEIREQLQVGLNNGWRETTLCPSGLHPDGRCSCESLIMHEESSTRTNISRILWLAEALLEALDEIHRQPVSLSLWLPAPESVVNSLPVKSHIKHEATGTMDDIEQCYICLAEYEEGDRIRILPCHHEYHMSCIDKWLKEIHGICPLCRGDVCEVRAESMGEAS